MAVVRARSSPPYALFVSIFLCVVFAGLAILFYVMYSKSVDDSSRAQETLAKIAGAPEQRNLQSKSLLDVKNPAARQMQRQIDDLVAMIGAGNGGSVDAIKEDSDLKPALEKYKTLKGALKIVTADRDEKAANLAKDDSELKAANDRAKDAATQLASQAQSDEQKVGQLQQQLTKAAQDLAAANKRADDAVAAAEAARNDAEGKAEESRRNLVLENEKLGSKNTQLTKENGELKDIIKNIREGPKALAGEPDGRITRVNAVANEVYITLTDKDRIQPGMTFTAYDPHLGVRYGTDEAAQGDGSIEVIAVGSEFSTCRITRVTPGHAIQQNDLIANVVYHNDKSRKTRFVIAGDFDLDGDGIATAAERDRLVRMIISWGGQVDDEVTSQTDYLVLGTKPLSATVIETTPAADSTATAPASIGGVRSAEQTKYDNLSVEAKSLSIPVLNANRFLAMIGYYNTSIVRY